MKRVLLGGLACALFASAVGGAESRTLRSTLAPTVLAQASEIPMPTLSPIPDPAFNQQSTFYTPSNVTGQAYPGATLGSPIVGQPVSLYSNVRYHGTRNIAPCAVPTVIQVPDPCNKRNCCNNCVAVQVCVPPCEPCDIKVTRSGNKVRYDYGKYSVVVKTVGDHVVVHYGD